MIGKCRREEPRPVQGQRNMKSGSVCIILLLCQMCDVTHLDLSVDMATSCSRHIQLCRCNRIKFQLQTFSTSTLVDDGDKSTK